MRQFSFYFQCPTSISQFVIVEELVLFGEKTFLTFTCLILQYWQISKKFSFCISIDTSFDAASKRVNKNKEFLKKGKNIISHQRKLRGKLQNSIQIQCNRTKLKKDIQIFTTVWKLSCQFYVKVAIVVGICYVVFVRHQNI